MSLVRKSRKSRGSTHTLARAGLAAAVVTGLALMPAFMPDPAHAADSVTVGTPAELVTEFNAATVDTDFTLSPDFDVNITAIMALTNSSGAHLSIDGSGHTLLSSAAAHLSLTVGGTGSATISELGFTPVTGAANGGLRIVQNDSAEVTLNSLDLSGMANTALSFGGSGTGDLLVEDVTVQGNTASSAAGLSFARQNADANSVMNRISVIENEGRGGYGYSGGAMAMPQFSRGNLTISNSLFQDNAFRDAGSLPRGGAIAMHNSFVQLNVVDSVFDGNSVDSTQNPANADGGAISIFNSTANTNGSLSVSGSTFMNNTAQDDAAAIFIEGRNPVETPPYVAKVNVTNSTFVNNSAGNAGGNDSGGTIQASLRAELNVEHSTFSNNTKTGGGGLDVGIHVGITLSPFQIEAPYGTLNNNIFTSSNSHTGFDCTSGLPCAVSSAQAATITNDVFGTPAPEATSNGSTISAGDSRAGKVNMIVPTIAIAPPLTPTTLTASRTAVGATTLTADQRGVPYHAEDPQDVGSVTMGYVHYDAAENGGSWAGLTPTVPADGAFISDATASHGWFEVSTPGATVLLPATAPNPPAHHILSGWFTQAEGGELVTRANANNQTVYAQFTPVDYTVTFDPQNGDAVTTEQVPYNTGVTEPAEPVRDGYTFDGWTLNDAPYVFGAPVTEDITLMAHWTENPVTLYTVTFDPQNGDAVTTYEAEEGEELTEPVAPQREGYTFDGWTLNGAPYIFGTPVTEDITLVGTWSEIPTPVHTVTFDPQNGDAVTTVEVEENDPVAQPADPTRDGYNFDGWTLNDAPYVFGAPVTEDITLMAHWTPVTIPTYTVTFDPQNGDAVTTYEAEEGEELTEPVAPQRDGYTFDGWTLNGAPYIFGTAVTEDITLVGTWSEIPTPVHTVTFDPQNGDAVTTVEVEENDPVAQPADPTRDGYTFDGWTLNDAPYVFGAPVTEDITLMAHWTEIPVTLYTVIFDPQNGDAVTTYEAEEGEELTEPVAPQREGYTFDGWTLNDAPYIFGTPVTEDITLLGTWSEIPAPVYTVIFDPQNGDAVTTFEVESGEELDQPQDPQRVGYTFDGWTLNGAPYIFGSPVTEDLTLVGTWTPVDTLTYTVTFDPQNGDDVTTYQAEEGERLVKPVDPLRNGYSFDGWTLDGVAYEYGTPVTGDITLVGTWSELAPVGVYVVTFDPQNGEEPLNVNVDADTAVSAIADPTRLGYTFEGWQLNGVAYDFNAPVTSNLTLVAAWTAEVVPPTPAPTPAPPAPAPPAQPAPGTGPALSATGGVDLAPAGILVALVIALGATVMVRTRTKRH